MDVQTISIALGGIGLFIAAINSIISSRKADQQHQTEIETRQAELFMNVYNRWNTRDIQTAYGNVRHLDRRWQQYTNIDDHLSKFSVASGNPENLERWFHGQILVTYFEGLGMLVKKGLIDIDMVDDLLAGRIRWFWETIEPVANNFREYVNDPRLYDSIEYLYNAIVKHEQQVTVISS